MAKILLETGDDNYRVSNDNSTIVAGVSGTQTVSVAAGIKGTKVDSTIEDVDFSGAMASYKFNTVNGSDLQITNAAGDIIATVTSAAANGGKELSFTDGSVKVASTLTDGAVVMSVGGKAINTTAATVTPDAANFDTEDKSTVTSTTDDTATGDTGTGYSLTKGLDNLVGDADNNTFTGSIDAGTSDLNTTSGIDTIDGGAGTDTFKLSSTQAVTTALLPTLTNVEQISVLGADNVTLDTTAITGITSLEVTKGLVTALTAAVTTDVTVSGVTDTIDIAGGKDVAVTAATTAKAIVIGQSGAGTTDAVGTITVTDTDNSGANVITVDGGTDVTVTATTIADASGLIKVGDTTQATGDVKVTQNLNGDGEATLTNSGKIEVEGGKTVDVTVNATTTAKTNTSDANITIAEVKVTGDSKTTDVTVTQNATATTNTAATVAQVDASSVVTFVAMAKGETTTVNGLTFTASKALTATEVASAFANLTNDDTQTVTGPTSNGYYTAASSTKDWVSGAASGATVTFTNATAGELADAMTVSDTAAAGDAAAVTTAGTAATGGDFATNAVVYGAVVVDDHATAAIKTITLDGFNLATLGAGASLDALTTLNIANNTVGTDALLTSTSTTLALNVNNITSTTSVVNVGASVNNLTIGATTKASTFDLTAAALKDLTINADVDLNIATNSTGYATTNLKTVDVNGTAKVDLGILTTAVLNSFDASGNTGGVTATIDTATASVGTITDYIFSAGKDVVSLAETAVNTKVTLGAGDDAVSLVTGTTALAAMIDAGTGTDTLAMVAANATTASATTTFEANMSNFEKLSLGQIATTVQDKIDLDNMDDISYVVTAGTADTAEVTVVTTVSTAASAATTGSISLVVGGVTYSVAAGETVNTVAVDTHDKALTALAFKIATDARVNTAVNATGDNSTITITSNTGFALDVGTIASTLDTTAITGTNAVTSSQLTLDNMLNDGTVELTAAGLGAVVIMDDATGTTDTLNIITGDVAGVNLGTVVANGVETLDVSTTDTFTDTIGATDGNGTAIADGKDDANSVATLNVSGDKATTVNVDGAGDLTLYTASSVLTTVNASTMTGALTYTTTTNSVTVTGGTAKDTLTAATDDVKLNGGAGDDTLAVSAGADRTILDGGAGSDTFAINGAAATSSTYANITSVSTGDVIDFAAATTFTAAEITLSAGATETTQALMDLAVNNLALNEMGWFQTGGNTFIVMDAANEGTAGFVDGEDMVVMITGLVDLSTASFNSTNGTLEIA